MPRGNHHGGREYGDLQNWLDMTSHEDPLLARLMANSTLTATPFRLITNPFCIVTKMSIEHTKTSRTKYW